MKFFLNTRIRTILLHLFFWTAVWFFFYYFFSYNSDDTAYVTWFSSFLLPLTMVVTYYMVYSLIPKYLLTRKYALFALYSFYLLVFSSYIIVLIIYGCLIFLLGFNISIMPPMGKNFYFILILVYIVAGVVGFISLLNHNYRTTSRNRELQNKILAAQLQLKEQELHYLKMQIQPHFLFNTLNTIYGFAISQSRQTPAIILKLSNLLDYILYRIDKPRVSLEEEVLHIREYIELEKMRFRDSLDAGFTCSEIGKDITIAPMLLIPFVENAFKHGTYSEGSLHIKMDLKLKGERLDFEIRNSYSGRDRKEESNGIGLENVRKRLELHYPGNYELDFDQSDGWFSVSLSVLNLKSIKNEQDDQLPDRG